MVLEKDNYILIVWECSCRNQTIMWLNFTSVVVNKFAKYVTKVKI